LKQICLSRSTYLWKRSDLWVWISS